MQFNHDKYFLKQEKMMKKKSNAKTRTFIKNTSKYCSFGVSSELRSLVGKDNNAVFMCTALVMLKHNPKLLYSLCEKSGISVLEIQKKLLFEYVLSITFNSECSDNIKDNLINAKIITQIIEDNDVTILITPNFGKIRFKPYFDLTKKENKENIEKCKGSCHQISEMFLENHKNHSCLTGILETPDTLSFYHSIVETPDLIMDLTCNMIFNKEDYFKISNFKVLNKVKDSKDYDTQFSHIKDKIVSSNTIELLSIALYKEYTSKQHKYTR